MSVDTKNVSGRRPLRFNSLDDIEADLNSLEGKPLKVLGNWSVGQILAHLSVPMNGAIDGMGFRPAWYFRIMGRFMKNHFLNGTMPPGFKLPRNAEAELVPGATSTEEGFAAIRKALHRLKTETHRVPSPFLGPMSIDDWNKMNCRHCELHLSFIVPEA